MHLPSASWLLPQLVSSSGEGSGLAGSSKSRQDLQAAGREEEYPGGSENVPEAGFTRSTFRFFSVAPGDVICTKSKPADPAEPTEPGPGHRKGIRDRAEEEGQGQAPKQTWPLRVILPPIQMLYAWHAWSPTQMASHKDPMWQTLGSAPSSKRRI
jgi:hypothetical protein